MECNKNEAEIAKEVAEKKFEAKDYLGSQKFALKAQSLYPNLKGIQHLLTTLNVYISSEKTVNGEINWYKVLDVNPNSDEDTIKNQYRKLALIVHPDKNKYIGADGAFILISEAWKLLSDKSQRSVYDHKRNIKKFAKPKPSTKNPTPEAQKGKPFNRKSRMKKYASTGPSNQRNDSFGPTFWTVCHRCRLQHEYLRKYLHQNIFCSKCMMAFYAYEYPPPILQKHSQWNQFMKNRTGYPLFEYPSHFLETPNQWNHFMKKNAGYSSEYPSHVSETPTQWNHFMKKNAGYSFDYPSHVSETPTQWNNYTEGCGFSCSHPSDQTNFNNWDPFPKVGGTSFAAQHRLEKEVKEKEWENALNAAYNALREREASLESMVDINAVKRRKVDESEKKKD